MIYILYVSAEKYDQLLRCQNKLSNIYFLLFKLLFYYNNSFLKINNEYFLITEQPLIWYNVMFK